MGLFSKFFASKEDGSALGIDIGSSAIKIVEVRKKSGQAILQTYGELALGPYAGLSVGQAVSLAPDKIAKAVSDLMKEKEVNVSTKRCGISIPFGASLMSVIEMPEVSAKQLSVMVPFEARKYIPVPISEVMLDWSIIPKSETDYTVENEDKQDKITKKIDVLVVAIHKDTIAKYQEIATAANLEPGFFEIEIFSTMRAVLDDTVKPVMIIDIGSASTKIYIVERGIVRTSHTVNRGSQDITTTIANSLNISPEQAEIMKRQVGALGEDKNVTEAIVLVLDYIFSEINNVLLAFEKKYNKSVAKVVMVGGGSALKGLKDLAKNNLSTDVFTGDPFSKVSAPAFLEKILRETGPEFAVAIGLALRKLSEN